MDAFKLGGVNQKDDFMDTGPNSIEYLLNIAVTDQFLLVHSELFTGTFTDSYFTSSP